MISERPIPFIFVHIPKCGGTSIERALLPYAVGPVPWRKLTLSQRRRHCLPCLGGMQHVKFSWFAEKYKIKDYLSFAFIRNPWDRAISQILYFKNKTKVRIFDDPNMANNLRTLCKLDRVISGHDFGATQLDYLKGLDGKLSVDLVRRFENLQEDYRLICSRLGIIDPPTLPHALQNVGRKHYSCYYNAKTAKLVADRFREDIETFGYVFQEAPPAQSGELMPKPLL